MPIFDPALLLGPIGGFLAALVPIIVAWNTNRASGKNAKTVAEASPYAALAERTTILEAQVGEHRNKIERLEDERRADRSLIVEIFTYLERNFPGRTFPFHRPEWMRSVGGS